MSQFINIIKHIDTQVYRLNTWFVVLFINKWMAHETLI